MNKRRVVLLPLLTLCFSLSSCKSDKVQLTYGTYINQTIFSLQELTHQELYDRLYNENETLIVAAYQGEYSQDCTCWATFENIVAKYMNTYHEKVYVFNTQNQDESIKDFKLDFNENGKPTLYIYKGKKKVMQFFYSKMQHNKIFEDTTAEYMYEQVHKYIKAPAMYYVDQAYIDNKLSEKKDDLAVLYVRQGCSDCQYVLPKVIIPYINEHELGKQILIYDLQKEYELSKTENATEEEKAIYQGIKDKYGLSASSNEIFGYQKGVVPTLQFYEKGELKDATIYFNDVVSQKEDGSFFLSDSYYSSERLNSLSYLKGYDFPTVLKDMVINSESVLQTKTGAFYWSQEEAAKYHTPILRAFLDYYMF